MPEEHFDHWDVTTTVLWIGKQITAPSISTKLILPSIVVCLVPLAIISPKFRNQTFSFENTEGISVDRKEGNIILVSGILLLLLVPVFKILTDLPPFMGILLALGILWILVSVLQFK